MALMGCIIPASRLTSGCKPTERSVTAAVRPVLTKYYNMSLCVSLVF